jgi:hypothetical protein
MADDIRDLGSAPLWRHSPNWARDPSTEIVMLRRVISERGTPHRLVQLEKDVPINFETEFVCTSKAEEKAVLAFFHGCRGRVKQFWIEHPRSLFDLKRSAPNGSSQLACINNNFDKQYCGYERFYMIMNNGDLITRKITGAEYDKNDDELILSFTGDTDRDINLGDYQRMGRLLLVRLDSDDLTIRMETPSICTFSLKFVELVNEYGAV